MCIYHIHPRYSDTVIELTIIIIITYVTVSVTTVTIAPAGDNNVVDLTEGETQTFTCTTDSSRRAAWIQWYIGGQNVTSQATSHPPQQDGEKCIASSSLVYTGRNVDHNTVIFCEAVNIERRQKVKSTEKSFYLQCKYYLPCNSTTSVLGCYLYEIINI